MECFIYDIRSISVTDCQSKMLKINLKADDLIWFSAVKKRRGKPHPFHWWGTCFTVLEVLQGYTLFTVTDTPRGYAFFSVINKCFILHFSLDLSYWPTVSLFSSHLVIFSSLRSFPYMEEQNLLQSGGNFYLAKDVNHSGPLVVKVACKVAL